MRIFVRGLPWLDGLLSQFSIADDATVAELTSLVFFDHADISDNLTLSHCGRIFVGSRALLDTGIQNDSVLTLSCKLEGGMLAMQIAYQRTKQAKKEEAENSYFVSLVAQVFMFLTNKLAIQISLFWTYFFSDSFWKLKILKRRKGSNMNMEVMFSSAKNHAFQKKGAVYWDGLLSITSDLDGGCLN